MIGGGPQKITVEIGGKIAASLGRSIKAAQIQVSSFGRNVSRTINDSAIAGKKGFKGIFDNALWQGAAAGATAIGVGLVASVRAAAKFEQSLTDISKTADLTTDQTKALGKEILKLTASDKTNQSAEQLAAGIKTLVGSGLTLQQAREAILGIGRVATATGSDITEVADTSYQLMQNLKVSAGDVSKTFEVLAAAGKQGSFELKDMAKEFPKVASSAQGLGIKGVRGAADLAAMLQVVRRGAGDSSTAANNLVNLLEKLKSKDAIANFAKQGVDLKKVIKDAQQQGLNPLEESLKVIQKITKGDPFKLNELFADMQVKAALAPLLKDFKDFQAIRDKALRAKGVIDKDYAKQLDTIGGRIQSFNVTTERLGIALGNALLPPLTKIARRITPVIEGIANFVTDHPRIATGIMLVGGALAGLVIALPIIAGVVSAIGTIGAPAIAIGLAIIGIGAAFVALYKQVGWFRNAVNSTWQVMGTVFKALITYWSGAWNVFIGILNGDTKKIGQGFAQIGEGIKATLGALLPWMGKIVIQLGQQWLKLAPTIIGLILNLPGTIINLFVRSQIGQRIITSIIDGLKAKAAGLFGWVTGAWARIKGLVGRGEAPAPAGGTPPGRAVGGRVRAGMPYVVGERRRELFVPGMDGAIIPRIARPAAGGGGVTINAPVTINAAGGDGQGIREQVRLAFEDLISRAYGDYRVALND